MADIVRLEENGVPQYLQTVPKAIIGLEDLVKIPDTGWVTIPYQNGPTGTFRARKINDLVYFSGIAYNVNEVKSGTTILTLPAQFRPAQQIAVIGLGVSTDSNKLIHMFYVNKDGKVDLVTPPPSRAMHCNLSHIIYTTL